MEFASAGATEERFNFIWNGGEGSGKSVFQSQCRPSSSVEQETSDDNGRSASGLYYYEVLGLMPGASKDEIRRAYHGLCKLYHPDKSHSSSSLRQYFAVQCAYNVLFDDMSRLLYDLRCGRLPDLRPEEGEDEGDGDSDEMKRRRLMVFVYEQQKEKAERCVENMAIDYETKRSLEERRQGLVIVLALYGNLSVKTETLEKTDGDLTRFSVREDDMEGPWLDVTVPIQCLVDKSRLILPGGGTVSKADLEGLYNPMPHESHEVPVSLYILYRFKGVLHEITVGDKDPLAMPLKCHRITPQRGGDEASSREAEHSLWPQLHPKPRGPFAPANASKIIAMSQQRQQTRHDLGQTQGESPQPPTGRLSVKTKRTVEALLVSSILASTVLVLVMRPCSLDSKSRMLEIASAARFAVRRSSEMAGEWMSAAVDFVERLVLSTEAAAGRCFTAGGKCRLRVGIKV